MGFGAEDNRGKVPFVPHHIQGTYYQRDLTVGVDFHHLAEVIRFVSFSTVKLLHIALPLPRHPSAFHKTLLERES